MGKRTYEDGYEHVFLDGYEHVFLGDYDHDCGYGSGYGRRVAKKRGGAGWVVSLVVLVGGLVGVRWLSGYLQAYAPDPVAAAHVNVGTWAVGVVLVLLVMWAVRPGSGGSR